MDITALNWADYVIISIVFLSMIIGVVRGFVKEALSLATWIIAILVAVFFSSALADLLAPYIENDPLRIGLSFFILFVVTLIIGALINFLISQLVKKSGLSGTDRLLGILFGAARGTLLVAILMLVAGLSTAPKEDWWQKSQLIPYFKPIAVWLQGFLPDNLEFFSADKTNAD